MLCWDVMGSSHLRRLLLALLFMPGAASLARAQAPASPGSTSFSILVRATPVGSEQVTVERTAQGWVISSSGRIGPPLEVVLRST